MSFESCSKKRALEDNVDHQAKPGIDDFCRKKFKPIAPKPTLKKDQHQAVVLATLPVKSSYLEDNDGCKLKYGGAADPAKQMVLMSPPHMHVMSNLPVMLHTPTLVAMNSCNPMPVLANYSFVIPVGCGHCNCGKSTQPVVCKSPPKNFCSHCHDEPCCKKDIERATCKSCDCSSEGNCKKSMDENTEHPYSRKTPQVPILPLNASLPSNLKEILKLRPEKYKYSMLLNSPGTYNQIAEKTARQTNSIQLFNCSVASENQFRTVTTSSGYSSNTHCTPFSATVSSSCSLTGPTVHSHTQSTSLELNSSMPTLSRNLVLPSVTPSSKSTSVPTYTPVVSSASKCSNFTNGPVHPSPQRSNNSVIEESPTAARREHSGNKSSHNEADKRTLNSLGSLNPDEMASCHDSPYIPFDTNTSVVQTNHNSNSFLSSTASSLVSMSHSISSAGPVNTRRSSVPTGATVPTEYRPLANKEAETLAQKRKKVSPSVEFLSASSRTVPSMPSQRPGAHIDRHKNVNAPVLQRSVNVTTGTVQSSVTTLINTMHNTNTRMTVPSPRSKDNNINVHTSQRLHHRHSQPEHNTRRAFEVAPVSHQRSSIMTKEQVAPEKTSEPSRIGSIPSQCSQIPNSSPQQISSTPLTVNRIITSTSRGHIPFHNSIVNTSSNLVSNVTGRIDSVRERYMAATVTSSTVPSQTRMTERLSIGVAGMSSAGFQSRPHTTEHTTASKQSDCSKNGTVQNRRRSEDTNNINTSCLPVSSNVLNNLSNRPRQASTTQSLSRQNVSCQRSNNLQTDRRPREFLREPQRETQEKDLSSSTPRREWPCMIPQVPGSSMATSFPGGDPINPLQNNSLSTASSWTDFTRHNHVNQARPVPTSNDACRQTKQQSSIISSQSPPTNPDATLPRTVQSDSIIQTVPLISNVPASSRLPPNSAITRKPRQRCCLPRQESSTLPSETTSSSLSSPIEQTQHTRASCSALGSHKTPIRGSELRLPNIFPPGMDKRLHHSHSMHAHSQVTEQRPNQPAGSDHPVSDLPFTHQNHNPVPRPMLYNFPHMLNSQSDIQHRFPIPGGLGRHPLTSHHMNHLQECNLTTPSHSTPHGTLHQPSSRHLLVPPPPFSSMHRSMFMSPSPHPPDVNLMSPRSFPSTHMHDNLLYSPASISRLPTTPGFPDRLHTSYPVHYLPEDRMDSCCSGGLRTSHSPTTNNFSAPWLLSSPSRTPAPPFLPSFPRHNSLSNLASSQDFYGFGSSHSMNNITAPHHMPGCLSEMNIQRHNEPLHIQTDTQAERDATGSSQLSPIVTPPPAAETLTRPTLRNTSSEPALILPAMNTASEALNNHPVRRNIMENPGNPLLARNTLRENQVGRPSIRSTSSETSSQHPPARRTSSEQCMGQTPIATSILNHHRDKNSGKSNHPTTHNSTLPMTAAAPSSISGRRSSSVQNPSVQQQPNVSLSQPASQATSISDTPSQMMPPSPATQRLNNKYLPIDETNSNPLTSQVPLVPPSPTHSLSEQPVKFNGVILQCSRQILCESGRTVLCCWNCDFHTAEPKKMHRHQRREEKVMRCQLCSFTGNSRCKVDQHFKENHLDKDDPFSSAV